MNAPDRSAQPVDVLAVNAAVAAAHDPIIVHNSLTRAGGYSPYCMRCTGLVRMEQVGVLHWRHHCGAEHDEAEARAALARAYRLRAEAFRAEAEASRLNPWTPTHHNRTRADQCEASAAHYLDMAAETEGEMA